MAYTVTTTITKPENISWWGAQHPNAAARYGQAVTSHPGVAAMTNVAVTNTTWTTNIVCANSAVWASLVSSMRTNSDAALRHQYIENNKLPVTMVFTHS